MVEDYVIFEFKAELFKDKVEYKKRIIELIQTDKLYKVRYTGLTSNLKAKKFSIHTLSKENKKKHKKTSIEYQQEFLNRYKDYNYLLLYNK